MQTVDVVILIHLKIYVLCWKAVQEACNWLSTDFQDINNFFKLLSVVTTDSNRVIIAADFNIHIDNLTDKTASYLYRGHPQTRAGAGFSN